jgi:hypothetical protein
MKVLLCIALLLGALGGAVVCGQAQDAVPPPAPDYQSLAPAQLDQLLGPIALYPDPLIAVLLPAATFPDEIVLADRYVSSGGDPNALDQQPWDPSVQALARYPTVLQWMDQNLDWTTELGQAFLNQQQDVMDSIQRLRQSAYNMGNLQSTPQEQVLNDGGYIEILPADPQEIYVPVYDPAQVYYVAAAGAPFITFGVACAIGPWLNCDFDWDHHNIIVWGRDHPRPADWWRRSWRDREREPAARYATAWHAARRPAGGVVNRADRGWGEARPVVTADRKVPVPEVRREPTAIRPAEPMRHEPAPVEHFEPARTEPAARSEPNGALIGIQSSRDVRTFSSRGQQSIQAVSRPAPSFGGGGGGGRKR